MGQELAFESKNLDTNIYDWTKSGVVYQRLSPLYGNGIDSRLSQLRNNFYFNKKTGQYDIFVNETKVASVNCLDTVQYKHLFCQLISQTVFNSNDDWEVLWGYSDSVDLYHSHTILTASDRTIIWKSQSDEVGGQVYFDDKYTYLSVTLNKESGYNARYYRFHPAIPSVNSTLLKKSSASTGLLQPLFSFNPAGDYTLKLNRSSGGATNVSLLNLLGQQIFSKNIPNLDNEVTITLPSGTVIPQTMITKVQNSNGTLFAKTMPMR
jgi:hypothetical protein